MVIAKRTRKLMGLYKLIGGEVNGDIDSKDIVSRINYRMSEENQQRLREWAKELAFWEEYGQIYENLEKAQPYTNLSNTFKEFLNPNSGEVWMDVGCGPLRISELIFERSRGRVATIEAIDIVLEPGREKLQKLDKKGIHPPVNLQRISITDKLPFPDNKFDGIGANLVLPYVTDFDGKRGIEAFTGVMREMFRVLKPDGQLIWSTPKNTVNFNWVFLASIPDMLNFYRYIKDSDFSRLAQGVRILRHALEIQRKGREGIYTFLPFEELSQLLIKIGFKNLSWKKTFAQQVWVNKAIKPRV